MLLKRQNWSLCFNGHKKFIFGQCLEHVVNFTGDLNRDTSYWVQDGEAGGQACAEDKNQIDCKLALSSVWVPGF